jgi:hypothetical protein
MKLSIRVNKKLIMISLAGLTGTMFIAFFLFQSMVQFEFWTQSDYMTTFIILFLSLGFLYASNSFPAFRSNSKSLAYLMLPASNSEKYVFELLTRIVAFIIIMPVLYWIVANIEGIIVHQFVPKFVNYKFSYIDFISKFLKTQTNIFWGIIASSQAILFVFTAAFAGASHFSKSPIIKTLFTFSIIVVGYDLYTYLLYRAFNLKEYHPTVPFIFFTKDRVLMLFALGGLLINLTLLAIAWFRLKEKEA